MRNPDNKRSEDQNPWMDPDRGVGTVHLCGCSPVWRRIWTNLQNPDKKKDPGGSKLWMDPDLGLLSIFKVMQIICCSGSGSWRTYRALVRLLAGVATHMYDEHVLGLEGFLLSRTVPPLAHEMLLVRVDMVIRDVLKQKEENQAKL